MRLQNEMDRSLSVLDLMIGDWIGTPKGALLVRAISQDGTVLCGDSPSPSEWQKFTEYEIYPIALMWKTLIDNGFDEDYKDDPLCSSCHYKSNGFRVNVSFLNDLSSENCRVCISKDDTQNNSILIAPYSINYVHELLHLFRLFGIAIDYFRFSDSYMYDPMFNQDD